MQKWSPTPEVTNFVKTGIAFQKCIKPVSTSGYKGAQLFFFYRREMAKSFSFYLSVWYELLPDGSDSCISIR
jgi:hypothetical protein